MNNILENIYTKHHTIANRLGYTILGDTRGEFLRKHIGTGKKVLDIGCRDGVLTAEYVANNYVLGIDIDKMALMKASKKLGIKTRQINLYDDWGIEKNSFDAVVAGEVLEHLYYPDNTVNNVVDVLKQDGIFVGSVPNAFNLKNRIRLFLGKKKNTPLYDPTHINHFSHGEIKSLLYKYFENVEIYPLGKYAWIDKVYPGMFSFGLLFKASHKRRK